MYSSDNAEVALFFSHMSHRLPKVRVIGFIENSPLRIDGEVAFAKRGTLRVIFGESEIDIDFNGASVARTTLEVDKGQKSGWDVKLASGDRFTIEELE